MMPIEQMITPKPSSHATMKLMKIGLGVALLCQLLSGAAGAATIVDVRIINLIDGRDRLVFQGDTVYYQHFDYAAVGRHDGGNMATHFHITTTDTDTGLSSFDTVSWVPDWSAPPPNEIRFRADSSKLIGETFDIGKFGTNWSLSTNWTRCAGAYIVQQPKVSNDNALIVEFQDNRCKSSAVFDIVLSGQVVGPTEAPAPVPLPAAFPLLMAALGGLGFVVRGRKAA